MPPSPTLSKSADDQALARLGKKQVLKRRFGFWSLFGFAVCELITWETVLALFSQGFYNGGPGALVFGFIIAWGSTFSVYTVISELASLAPIASGQYYWTYMLSPERYRVFLSYIIGWLTTMAWIATVTIETLFAGTMLQGILVLNYGDYAPTTWQGTLLTWLVITVCVFINTVIPGALPRIEITTVVFHILGFVAILATLWACGGSHNTASFVFTTSINKGGWSSQGLSYCVGFLGNVATFVGADASVHLAEEVSNANLNIPRAILSSMIVNGLVGFTMMVTVLFAIGDVQSALDTKTGFPYMQIFYGKQMASTQSQLSLTKPDRVKSLPGATVMCVVVLLLTWTCATGLTTSASRMTWAFARDLGVPFSSTIKRVTERTRVPVIATGVVTACAVALTLIYIGSPVAFNDVISLTITGFYGSYLVPASLLLYRRVKGEILPHRAMLEGEDPSPDLRPEPETAVESVFVSDPTIDATDIEKPKGETSLPPSVAPDSSMPHNPTPVEDDNHLVAYVPSQLYWGPWKVPGLLGIINNAYACLYMVFVIFWSVWPPETPVNPTTMNYSVLVTGGVILFSIFWYYVRGRKEYRGPLLEKSSEMVRSKEPREEVAVVNI